MTDIVRSEGRVRSQQTSPVPRRQLGSLSVNQRSYSRVSSSKGMFGDESPLLSPLPYYPRRRSVTFTGEGGPREERPLYKGMHSASAPVSPVRRAVSPPPVGILKRGTGGQAALYSEEEGARPGAGSDSQPGAAAALRSHKGSARSSPVPQQRGRSASRQRLAARRREAQLHHSFYDDSFVEEFVLTSRAEMEREEAERQLEAQAQAEREKARRAERKAAGASENKMGALQHAREVLLAAAQRRRSATPTPSPARTTASRPAEADLLKSLEEDSDPEIQSALAELSRVAAKSAASRRSSRAAHLRRSMPIVSEGAPLDSDSEDDGGDSGIDAGQRRKRARLERVVGDILSQQEKQRGKSKRSVVVINWSDADDEESRVNSEGDEEKAEPIEVSARGAAKQPRRAATKSRSVALTTEATVIPSRAAPKAPSARRAASRKRNASAAPDLGDSLLFENEEDQPILLPRRQPRRPVATRSISAFNAQADDLLLSENDEAVRRVTRRAPRINRAARKAPPPAPARVAVPAANDYYDYDYDMDPGMATPPHAAPAPAPRARRAPTGRGAPKVSPDDPMSVFFDAAFPSPSKFDAMMQQAGGLPESRRANGNRGRQPNLVLPSSIGRRR